MANRAPLTLKAYRLLTALAVPFANMVLNHRLKRGKELAARLPERRGESSIARPEGPLVWLHGASVGEMLSILPLIDRIRARDITVLVTAGTVTAAELAERRLPPGVIHQFAPLDMPQFVARFLDHWRPNLALFVESDLWPNLIMAGAERGIPLILVNGRVSERSFQRWRFVPRTIGALLSRFDLCLAQSAEDAARYAGLGAPRYVTTGNLKLDVPAPPADPDQALAAPGRHRHAPGDRRRLDASGRGDRTGRRASKAQAQLSGPADDPGAAASGAGRGIAGIARGAGLKFAQRSLGELPDRDTEIYVADTLGELGVIYRLAPIVFIGGSLVGHGGQNPIEAAKLGAAILHGPHVWNFAEIYSALDAAGGAEMVTDTGKLTVRIGAWLKDAEAREEGRADRAAAMDTLAGALERTVAALDPYLMQFRSGAARGPGRQCGQCVSRRSGGVRPGLTAGLLSPLAAVYGAVAAWRMAQPGRAAGIPVLCVGNLTLGGAGKTPAAIAVAQILDAAGRRPFVLSRGYGGALAGSGAGRSGAPSRGRGRRRAAAAGAVRAHHRCARPRRRRGRRARGRRRLDRDGRRLPESGAAQGPFDPGGGWPPRHRQRQGVSGGSAAGAAREPASPRPGPAGGRRGAAGEAVAAAAQAQGLPVFHGRLEPDAQALAVLKGRPVLAFAGIGDPENSSRRSATPGSTFARGQCRSPTITATAGSRRAT